jgi:hypothetical protein
MNTDKRSNRGGFLKQVGVVALAGVGISLFGARSAWAAGSHCCPVACQSCPPGEIAIQCTDRCLQTVCCWCTSFPHSQCWDTGCAC